MKHPLKTIHNLMGMPNNIYIITWNKEGVRMTLFKIEKLDISFDAATEKISLLVMR